MIYTPHILQKRVLLEPQRDEFGRIIHDVVEDWEEVCKCRCDDNDTASFSSDNGSAYTPKYRIVCNGSKDIPAGEYIRCVSNDGSIRGEGEVYRTRKLNFLPYSEIWV